MEGVVKKVMEETRKVAFAPVDDETTNEPAVIVEANEPMEDGLMDEANEPMEDGLMDELFQLLDNASTQTKLDAINSSATDSETKQSLVARYLHQRWPLTGETTTPFKEVLEQEKDEHRNYYEEHLDMAWEEMKRGDVLPFGNEPPSTRHQRKNKSTVPSAASPKHILLPRQKKNALITPITTPSIPAPLSNVSTMSLKERTERMAVLSTPNIDRSTSRPKPPALSTSCPDLAVHVIEALQAQDTLPVRSWHRKAPPLSTIDTRRRSSAFASLVTSSSDKRPSSLGHTGSGGVGAMTMDDETVTPPVKQNSPELIQLPLSADRLRITITAEVDEMWRKVHKGAFRARAYTRNDTTRSGHLWEPGALIDPAELRKQFSDQSASSNHHSSSTSSGTGGSSSSSSGGVGLGVTLPGGEEDGSHATSSETTSSKDQMRQFFGSFRLEFICLVLDVHMQVLGTYDVSLRKYIPGLDLGPDFVRRETLRQQQQQQQQQTPAHQKDEQYYNHANVLEINFNELPKQVFAIVPMFLDESNVSRKELIKEAIVKAKQFQDFSFRLDMFCHARPPESYTDHIDTLFENEAEVNEKKISEWDIPEDDIIDICNGNKAAGGAATATGGAGTSAFRGTSGPTKKKKFKPTAKSAPTAEEEEAWMRQSWSLPQSVSLFAATGGVAAVGGEKPPVGRNSQSLTAIKYPNKRASTPATSGTSTMLPVTQEGVAATGSLPTPDLTASVLPGELPSRWVQLPDSSQRIGRLLPQQLRDLFKQKGQDTGSHGGIRTTATATAAASSSTLGGEKSEKKKKTAAPEDVEAWQKLDAVFGVADAYIPFAVFRRAASSGGWAVKKMYHRVHRCAAHLDQVLRDVLVRLARSRVLPYHLIHVEHCSNCESHQATTRHVPGSYEEAYAEFRTTFKQTLPPSLLFSNNRSVCPSAFRVGSFEVLVRPYNSTVTRFVYSKLQSNRFPDYLALSADVSPVFLPTVRAFRKETSAMLEVVAFDACTRKLVDHAEVSVYRVGVSVMSMKEALESAVLGDAAEGDSNGADNSFERGRRSRRHHRHDHSSHAWSSPNDSENEKHGRTRSSRRSPSPDEAREREQATSAVFFSTQKLDRRRYTSHRELAINTDDGDDDHLRDAPRDWSPTHAHPTDLAKTLVQTRSFNGNPPLEPMSPLGTTALQRQASLKDALKESTLKANATMTDESKEKGGGEENDNAEVKEGEEGKEGQGKDDNDDKTTQPVNNTTSKTAARPQVKKSRFIDSDDDNKGKNKDRDTGKSQSNRGAAAAASSSSSRGRQRRARGTSADRETSDGDREVSAERPLTATATAAATTKRRAHARTKSYANVCTWTKNDVVTWFRVYGASDDVLDNAILAGVIDGPSFSELVTLSSLQKWGVRSRKILKRLEDGLSYVMHAGVGAESNNHGLVGAGNVATGVMSTGGGLGLGVTGGPGATMTMHTRSSQPTSDSEGGQGPGGGAANWGSVRSSAVDQGSGSGSLIGYGAHAAATYMEDEGGRIRKSVWGANALCIHTQGVLDDGVDFLGDLEPAVRARQKALAHMYSYSDNADPAGVDFQLVSRGFTSSAGLFRARIPLSGSYLVKIVAGQNAPYTSNILSLQRAGARVLYAASLKPAMVTVVLSIRLSVPIDSPYLRDPIPTEDHDALSGQGVKKNGWGKRKKKKSPFVLSFVHHGCMVSLLNVMTGERFVICLPVLHREPSSQGGAAGKEPVDPAAPVNVNFAPDVVDPIPKDKIKRKKIPRSTVVMLRGQPYVELTEDGGDTPDDGSRNSSVAGSVRFRGKTYRPVHEKFEEVVSDEDYAKEALEGFAGVDQDGPAVVGAAETGPASASAVPAAANGSMNPAVLAALEKEAARLRLVQLMEAEAEEDHEAEVVTLYATEVRLPAGKYLCEVGGTLVVIYPTPSAPTETNTPRNASVDRGADDDSSQSDLDHPHDNYHFKIASHLDSRNNSVVTADDATANTHASSLHDTAEPDVWDDLHQTVLRSEFPLATCQQTLTNAAKLVVRCHKRLLRRAIRTLQAGVRAHIAWYNRNLKTLVNAIYKNALKFVLGLRRMVRIRLVTLVQTNVRRYLAKRKYQFFYNNLCALQTRIKYRRQRHRKIMTGVLLHWQGLVHDTFKLYFRLRAHVLLRRDFEMRCLLFDYSKQRSRERQADREQRARATIKTSFGYRCRRWVRHREMQRVEAAWEKEETVTMRAEDVRSHVHRQRLLEAWQEEQQRLERIAKRERVLQERGVNLRQYAAATKIQATYRGYVRRALFADGKWAVVVLQGKVRVMIAKKRSHELAKENEGEAVLPRSSVAGIMHSMGFGSMMGGPSSSPAVGGISMGGGMGGFASRFMRKEASTTVLHLETTVTPGGSRDPSPSPSRKHPTSLQKQSSMNQASPDNLFCSPLSSANNTPTNVRNPSFKRQPSSRLGGGMGGGGMKHASSRRLRLAEQEAALEAARLDAIKVKERQALMLSLLSQAVDRRAIVIQSLFRMYHARYAYCAQLTAAGKPPPPLFRHCVPIGPPLISKSSRGRPLLSSIVELSERRVVACTWIQAMARGVQGRHQLFSSWTVEQKRVYRALLERRIASGEVEAELHRITSIRSPRGLHLTDHDKGTGEGGDDGHAQGQGLVITVDPSKVLCAPEVRQAQDLQRLEIAEEQRVRRREGLIHLNDVLLSLKSGMTDLELSEQVLPPCSGDWFIVINTVNGQQSNPSIPYGDDDNNKGVNEEGNDDAASEATATRSWYSRLNTIRGKGRQTKATPLFAVDTDSAARQPDFSVFDCAYQSPTQTSFDAEALAQLDYTIHLTDLDHCTSLEIELYIEFETPPPAVTAAAKSRGSPFGTPFRSRGAPPAPTPTTSAAPGAGNDNGQGLGLTSTAAANPGSAGTADGGMGVGGGRGTGAGTGPRTLVAAFVGSVQVDDGLDQGPCGARLHVVLHPNTEELSQFPQAAPLLRASPLHLLATLLPVALPSTELLRLFRPVSLPAPCYPSALIDATNLDDEEWSLDWDHQTSGVPLCVCACDDGFLISSGGGGGAGGATPTGRAPIISEFDGSGQCLGTVWTGTPLSSASQQAVVETSPTRHPRRQQRRRLTPPADEMTTTMTLTSPGVTMMVSGHRHVVLCGSDGKVAVARPVRDEKQLRAAQKRHYGVVEGYAKGDEGMDDDDDDDLTANLPSGKRRHSAVERTAKARGRDASIRRSRGSKPGHRSSQDLTRTGSNKIQAGKMMFGRSMLMIPGRKGGMGGLLGDDMSMEMGVVGGWTLPRVLGRRWHEEEEESRDEEEEEGEDEEEEEEEEEEEGESGLVSPQNQPKQRKQHQKGDEGNQRLVSAAEPADPTDDGRRVVAVCVHAIPGAGIEVLVTATQAGRLAIYAVEGGRQICAHDFEQGASFLQGTLGGAVVALAAFDTQLYVATQTGALLVISLASLLVDGRLFDKDIAGRLKRHIAAEFPLFPGVLDGDSDGDSQPNTAGAFTRVVASMACVAPRSFLGLRNEDSARILLKSRNGIAVTTASSASTASNAQAHRAAADARWDEAMRDHRGSVGVEGHLLLVGGGDLNPYVKIFRPTLGTSTHPVELRLLTSLKGHHSTAVTQVLSDAAGRCFFSASISDGRICIWDGLTFANIRVIECTGFHSVAIGLDCLIAIGATPVPFVRLWAVGANNDRVGRLIASKNTNNQMGDVDTAEDEQRLVSMHHIHTIRNARWCSLLLKGEDPRVASTGAVGSGSNIDLKEYQRCPVPRGMNRETFLGARMVAKRWSNQLVHRIVYGDRHDKYEKEDLLLMMSVLALKRRGLISLYEDEAADETDGHHDISDTSKISKLKSEMKKHLAAGAVIDHRPPAALPLRLAVGSGPEDEDEGSQCSWMHYKRRKKPHFSDTDEDDDDRSEVDFVEDMEGSGMMHDGYGYGGDGDDDGGDSLWMSPSYSSVPGGQGLAARSGDGLFGVVESDFETSSSDGNAGTGGVVIKDRQHMKVLEAQKRKESLRLQAIAERQKKLKPRVLRHFIDEIDEVDEGGDRSGGGGD